MEIMGLAIIVVLLFLGMVFVVRFIVLQPPKDHKSDYVNTEMASNIIGAMLYTTAEDCSMVTFAKLFQDCASGTNAIRCNSGAGSEISCVYAQDKVQYMLDETLDKVNKKFHFQVKDSTRTHIEHYNTGSGGCPGEREHKEYPLPGAGNTIYVTLDICT